MKYRKDLTPDIVVEAYERLGCTESAAKELRCAKCTIHNRLRAAGYTDPIFQVKGRWVGLPKEDKIRYWKWKQDVFKRDGHRCRVCCSNARIEPHHIKTWEKHPELRFEVSNGITLCHECHLLIRREEKDYEEMFYGIIATGIANISTKPRYEDTTEKKCTRCGDTKRLEEFAPRPKEYGSKYGRHPWCRECEREVGREKYKRNPEKFKRATKRWFENNKRRRQIYIAQYNMEKRIRSGQIPRWTRHRAALGVVTKNRKDWPTKEVIRNVEDSKNLITFDMLGL